MVVFDCHIIYFQAFVLCAHQALLSEEENLLIINRLHQVLRPFVLRRLKHKVRPIYCYIGIFCCMRCNVLYWDSLHPFASTVSYICVPPLHGFSYQICALGFLVILGMQGGNVGMSLGILLKA